MASSPSSTSTSARAHRSSDRILVTGATGMLGGLLVDDLVQRGAACTVMVRPGSDATRFEQLDGVDVVRGDFDDPETLEAAAAGIDRAFLLTNSTERAETQQKAFVTAAADAGVRHLVKLSQLHAAAGAPVRFLRYHAAVEDAVVRTDMAHTFIRPNLVLQAYLPFAPTIVDGLLQAPIGEARVSMVDGRDIAAVAAAALTEAGHEGRTYGVTGPEAVTHAHLADALGRALGRDVRFEEVPESAFIDAVEASGMPPWQAEGLAEDYAHYRRGEAAGVSDDVLAVTGSRPRSVERFAQDSAAAFMKRGQRR